MPTKDDFSPDDPLPIFLFEVPKKPSGGLSGSLGQSRIVANPQDEYFGCNGDSDRYRNSIGGKSNCALCERHGFAGR